MTLTLILSILVFVTIIFIAIMVKTGWRPSTSKVGFPSMWGLGKFLLGLVAVVWLLSMSGCVVSCAYRTITAQPASSSTPTKSQRKLYLFSNFPDEIVRVKIRDGEVDFYPKGGEIEITTSTGNKITDSPGTVRPRLAFPSGEYQIKKLNPNAIGVEIWN